MKRVVAIITVSLMLVAGHTEAYAVGGKESAASFILPTTGQAMNGEFGTRKSKVMLGLEVAAIATIVVLGTAVGGGVVWAGVGPLIANHLWSSTDAYQSAQKKGTQGQAGYYSGGYNEMTAAQRTLDYSRQRRFDREQELRGTLYERVQQAGEIGYNS